MIAVRARCFRTGFYGYLNRVLSSRQLEQPETAASHVIDFIQKLGDKAQ